MKEYPIEVIVGKDALLGALKAASPASNAQSQQVVLTFTKGNLTISAEDYEFSKSASVSIPCDHEGKEFKIAFKHSWLAELVSNVVDDNVKLKFTANTKPALVVPETQNETVEYVYLQMPMMML
jgi:DNA polymerase-3 subunit beta